MNCEWSPLLIGGGVYWTAAMPRGEQKMNTRWRREKLGLLHHPCPHCGRQPRVYSKFENGGWFCRIECKSFLFGRTHCRVETHGVRWTEVWEAAVELWNELPRDEK